MSETETPTAPIVVQPGSPNSSAYLISTNWNMEMHTHTMLVSLVVQANSYAITVNCTEDEVSAKAVLAGRASDQWERVDLAAVAADAVGLPITVLPSVLA